MGFEYDHKKSEANKAKHGIDFEEGQALWDDPNLVEIPAKVTALFVLANHQEIGLA